MKNLKKIAALVIVLAMALSSMAFASFTDVADDASYNEAVTVMSALGLLVGYEDGSFGPDKTITRAEFSAVIVRALGMEDAARGSATNTRFADVTAEHWASGYVQMASQQGIIVGYGDGNFGPDDEVTYEQAIKMIVVALGYEPKFATVADPYPTSYLAQANTDGITVGALGRIGDKATRAIVARLVYNALDVPMMEQISFGRDVEYGVPTENYSTLLSSKLKVAKVEGSVESISFNKDDGRQLVFDITKIDDIYKRLSGLTVGNAPTLDYTETVTPLKGYSTIAYIDYNDDDGVLVALAAKSGRNNTLVLTSTQTKDAKVEVADLQLNYYRTSPEVDSRTTAVKLASNVKIYENLSTEEISLNDFATNYSGYREITLIDNDNNNQYDYIIATVYSSMVVGEITERTYRISSDGKYGSFNNIFLDPESDDVTFDIVDKDGKALAFEDIKKGDILNIFESKDGTDTYQKIIVTDGKITGSVSEKSSDDKYKIGDKYYKSEASVSVGDSGVFYVDMYGVVLKFQLEDSNRNFGYVYAAYESTTGLDDDTKIIIYTADGKFTNFDLNRTVNVNGDSYNKDNLVGKKNNVEKIEDPDNAGEEINNPDYGKTWLEDNSGNTLISEGDLAMYVANSSSAITEIYTEAGIDDKTTRDYTFQSYSAGNTYRASNQRLGSGYVTENSKLVTNKDKVAEKLSRDSLGMTSASVFNEDELSYKFQAIVDKNQNIVFAVFYELFAKAEKGSDVMFVTSTGTTTDSDGGTAQVLNGVVNEESVQIIVTTDTYKEDAKGVERANYSFNRGDMIQYNGSDEVSAVRLLLAGADLPAYTNAANGLNTTPLANGRLDENNKDEGFIYGGKVAEMKSNTISFSDGKEVYVPFNVPTMIVRLNDDNNAINRVYTNRVSVDMAETDDSNYTSNDDIVIVYKYDGDAYGAIVIDFENDTRF